MLCAPVTAPVTQRYTQHHLPNLEAPTNLDETAGRCAAQQKSPIAMSEQGSRDSETYRTGGQTSWQDRRQSPTPPPPPPLPPHVYANYMGLQPWANAFQGYPWQFFNQNAQWYGFPQAQPADGYNPFGQPAQFGQQAWGQTQQQVSQPEGHGGIMLQQDKYGALHFVRPHKITKSWRVDKPYRSEATKGKDTKKKAKQAAQAAQAVQAGQTQPPAGPKAKHKDPKIMLPAPPASQLYLDQAAEEPFVIDPPDRMLVVLDLNGTLIYRPNRKRPKHLIARPFLKPFLRYLFENFAVMVWSSAKPENVRGIVETVLDDELRSMLVASWGRDTFGLSPNHYALNVQVYKDLTKIWDKEEVQCHMPGYDLGRRFGQDNTILIDDSVLKANAQPHNLLEVPEFTATEEQMKSDILREVAGYLQTARMQNNVSSFMRKYPFKADGRWQYDWPDELADGGALEEQASLQTAH